MSDDNLFGAWAITIVIGLICLTVLVGWGLYEGGWWLTEDGVARRAAIADESLNRESSLRDEAIDNHETVLRLRTTAAGEISEAQRAPIEAQITAAVSRFCVAYGQIDHIDMPDHIDQFASQECP